MKSTSSRPPRRVVVTLDTWLSVAAVVTSLCALTITIYQAYLQRKQQYASVMPVLDSYLSNGSQEDGTYLFEFKIANYGVGPAFIQKAEIVFDGHPVAEMRGIIEQVAREPGVIDTLSTKLQSGLWRGRVLPQGQEITLLSVRDVPSPQQRASLAERLLAYRIDQKNHQIRLKIWYQSIYGETWLFDTKPDQPENRLVKLD